MFWLIIVLIAHFFNALVFIIDKYLLCARITKPLAYAFYLGVLGVAAVVLVPFFGLVLPNTLVLCINLASGFIYVMALIIFYYALQREEPSRVVPIVGALVAIFTLLLSWLLLSEKLGGKIFLTVICFIIGGILMAVRKFSISKKLLINICLWLSSSFLFGLSYVLIKAGYSYAPFLSGFIWARIGGFLAAILLLLIPGARKSIFVTTKLIKANTSFIFLGNQAMAAIGFVLINIAIALVSVSLVNALQSVQYIFILIIASILGKKYPKILFEEINLMSILQKLAAIIFIGFGLYSLFI